MNRFCSILAALICCLSLAAQIPFDSIQRREALEIVASNYYDWENIEISGKLKMDGLGVSPSLKIKMVRDQSIMISVRAPIYGEVARIECDSVSLLIVNKMKKKYFLTDTAQLLEKYPVSISNLQNILLARPFLLDGFEITEDDNDLVEVYYSGGDADVWSILPVEQPSIWGVSYGFDTDSFGQLLTFLLGLNYGSAKLYIDYYPDYDGTDIVASLETISNSTVVELDLDEPKESSKSYDPAILSDKYEQLEFRDFLNAMF